MNITYSRASVKAINSMDRATKQRIKAGILGLTQKPPKGDIRPLQGYRDGRFRLRIGGYRVIFRFSTEKQIEILHIMSIGPRGGIYK